jgi:hypothetical protein
MAQAKQRPKAPPAAERVQPDAAEKTWNLVLTLRPDQARKAADDLVQIIRNPSGQTPPILSDLLGILSARIAVDEGSPRGDGAATSDSRAGGMAAAACTAAIDALGQHADVMRQGYGALAAGLPDDRVREVRQQVQALATQLAAATRSAIDQVRKEPTPAQKR